MDYCSQQETTTASSYQVVANSATFKNHSRPVQVQQEQIQRYMQSLAHTGSETHRARTPLNQGDESPAPAIPCSETNPTATAQLVTGCTKTTVGYLSTSTELNTTAMNRPAVQETNPAATGVMSFANMDWSIYQ